MKASNNEGRTYFRNGLTSDGNTEDKILEGREEAKKDRWKDMRSNAGQIKPETMAAHSE